MSVSTLITLLKQDDYMDDLQHLMSLEVEKVPLEALPETEQTLSQFMFELQNAMELDSSNAIPFPEEFLVQYMIISGHLILRIGETQLRLAGGKLPKYR